MKTIIIITIAVLFSASAQAVVVTSSLDYQEEAAYRLNAIYIQSQILEQMKIQVFELRRIRCSLDNYTTADCQELLESE
jgi:hypothetical protein